VRTDFFNKTGHQLLGFTYSNKEFTSLDQRLMFETGAIQTKKNSWSLIYNFDQFFHEPQKGSGQGVGLFGRLGASDGNPNPVHYFASLGLGGKAPFGRAHDECGAAWYYMDLTSPKWVTETGTHEPLRDEQGFELYYKFALTPWALLTPDIQIVHGAQQVTRYGQTVTTATVLGLRLELVF
jgi:porin